MSIGSQDIVPLGQVRAKFTKLAEQVNQGSEKIITRNGESYVALVDAQKLDFYHKLEQEHFQRQLLNKLEKGQSTSMSVNELTPPEYNVISTVVEQSAINWKSAWLAASGIWKDHETVESDIQQIRTSWCNRMEL